MRAAKDTLESKKVALTGVVHVQSEQDERNASGLVFKRKRSEAPIPFEHSHSDDRAPTQNALTIQEWEVVGNSKEKSLWDPSFDISAYDRSCFVLEEDMARLNIYYEDRLRRDAKSLLCQATTLEYMADVKAEERKKTEGKRPNSLPNPKKRMSAFEPRSLRLIVYA